MKSEYKIKLFHLLAKLLLPSHLKIFVIDQTKQPKPGDSIQVGDVTFRA